MGLSEYIQIPYYCDDKDCHTWHIMLFDEDEGEIWEGDMDGNWDISTSDKLPDIKEQDEAWNDYAHWAVKYGEDPLGEFARSETKKVMEKWMFMISQSLIGPWFRHGRKEGGKVIENSKDLPEYVRDYLLLEPERLDFPVIGGVRTMEELKKIVELPDTIVPWPRLRDHSGYYALSCVIGRTVEINPTKKQIRAAARKHLKGYKHVKED